MTILSIFDINDEFKVLKKMVEENKMKPDVMIAAKKQLFEHIDLKEKEYTAAISKISREAVKKMEDLKIYSENMKEVLLYFQKRTEYEAKKMVNEAARMKGEEELYSALHMNNLANEILELEKRQQAILKNPNVDVELLGKQLERLNWLTGAINELKKLKAVIEKSTFKDKFYSALYKVLQAASFVLSIYGVFYLVDNFRERIHINEFLLHLIAGTIVLLVVDRFTDAIKKGLFQSSLKQSLTNFSGMIDEMQNVDKALADYTL